MTHTLPYIQLVISILLIIVIILQRSDKGLDGAFGGSDTGGGIKYKRRGPELFFYRSTIALSILLVASIVFSLFSINTNSQTNVTIPDGTVTATTSDGTQVPLKVTPITVTPTTGNTKAAL